MEQGANRWVRAVRRSSVCCRVSRMICCGGSKRRKSSASASRRRIERERDQRNRKGLSVNVIA